MRDPKITVMILTAMITSMQNLLQKLFMRSLEKSLDKTQSNQSHCQQHRGHCDDHHILFQHTNIYGAFERLSKILTTITNCGNYMCAMRFSDWCIYALLLVMLLSLLEWWWEINLLAAWLNTL